MYPLQPSAALPWAALGAGARPCKQKQCIVLCKSLKLPQHFFIFLLPGTQMFLELFLKFLMRSSPDFLKVKVTFSVQQWVSKSISTNGVFALWTQKCTTRFCFIYLFFSHSVIDFLMWSLSLLHNPSMLELRCTKLMIWHFLLNLLSINFGKSSQSPDHHTTTTISD